MHGQGALDSWHVPSPITKINNGVIKADDISEQLGKQLGALRPFPGFPDHLLHERPLNVDKIAKASHLFLYSHWSEQNDG